MNNNLANWLKKRMTQIDERVPELKVRILEGEGTNGS
jgi:hypothetical protein